MEKITVWKTAEQYRKALLEALNYRISKIDRNMEELQLASVERRVLAGQISELKVQVSIIEDNLI